jgi:hypothetical protein
MSFMKHCKYLFLLLIVSSCKLYDKADSDVPIYNLLINKVSGAKNAPWLGGKYREGDIFERAGGKILNLKIKDSIEKANYTKKFIVLVEDTCSDIKAVMDVLKYTATKNNGSYFTNDFDGDTSFNQFIMDYKSNGIKNKVLEIKNFNTKYKFNIKKKNEVSKDETVITNITFSNIAYNKNYSKAILYASAGSSGDLYFLTKTKNEWTIIYQIQSWVI